MTIVQFDKEFEGELETYPVKVQDKIAATATVLERFGPQLSRPRSDTLKGSKHKNMKELRLAVGRQTWRVAYAFDQRRRAILLCGGNKQGVNETKFYKELIATAEKRFDRHIARLKRR